MATKKSISNKTAHSKPNTTQSSKIVTRGSVTRTTTVVPKFREISLGNVWEDEREERSKHYLSRLGDLEKKSEWQGKQIDFTFYFMIGVVIVLGVAFVQLLSSYYQMVQNSFIDYKTELSKVRQDNSFESRITKLENAQTATQTAKTE